MEKLIITSNNGNVVLVESSDGVLKDGIQYGGSNLSYRNFGEDIEITNQDNVFNYRMEDVSFEVDGVLIPFTTKDEFLTRLKSVLKIEAERTENSAMAVGNAMTKFRDNFIKGSPDTSVWDVIRSTPNNGFLGRGGDASGSSYLRLFVSPYEHASAITLISKIKFKLPIKLGSLFSQSQRVLGNQFTISLVGCDENGSVEKVTSPAPLPILGTISITSNVATINFAIPHKINGLERLVVYGNTDSRLNVGPVYATIINADTITIPCTLANGTYTAGGFVALSPVDGFDSNSVGITTENTTPTNAVWFTRRNGASVRYANQTIGTTTATQNGNSQPYSDAFSASTYNELIATMQDVVLSSKPVDGLTGNNASLRYSSGIPDEEKYYKIKIEAKNLENITKIIGKIVSITKTGTTTATVTTDVPHNLNTSSFVQIYGVRDITNFPNLTAQTQIASIISPTQFTIIIGGAVTATSAGGVVALVNGSQAIVGAQNFSVQSVSRANDILTVIGNGTWASILPGEMWYIYGCDATSLGLYDDAYKVLRASTTTLELKSIGASFASINCGGAVIRATENRIHSIQLLDYTRLIVEQSNQNGMLDTQRASTVLVANEVGLTELPTPATLADLLANPSLSQIASLNMLFNGATWDRARGNFDTATGDAGLKTATFAGATQTNFGARGAIVTIQMGAVSGTTPTCISQLQWSPDGGITWLNFGIAMTAIIATGNHTLIVYPSNTSQSAGATPTNLTTNAAQTLVINAPLPRTWRLNYTLGGTTPSFNFTAVRVNYIM